MAPAPDRAPHRNPTRRPTATLFARTWWIGLAIAIFAGGGALFNRSSKQRTPILTGYVTEGGLLPAEYQRYFGRPLKSPELEAKFRQAEALTQRRDYAGASATLEEVRAQAPVPAVLNNLGVLYAAVNDRARALNSFRDGLARDSSYIAIRRNLDRLKELSADSSDPLTEELEPNGTLAMANLIAVDRPVEARIAGNQSDEDTYRFVTPPPPRDVLALKISSPPAQLIPALRLYDANHRLMDLRAEQTLGNITHYITPAPGATLFLQVSGAHRTSGDYVLTIQSMKAFDEFEPDDGIFDAHRIIPGAPVEANIMDAADTDYYQFTAPRTGQVGIEIENRSTTLIPALTTFSPDRRNTGFGPDLRTPGVSLSHRIEVQEKLTYFIQVWSQGNSSGAYTLTVN